jgi:hypothetical protein
MRTLRTRLTHSTSDSRSPSASAASSVETRSSPGSSRRAGQQRVGVVVELDDGLLDQRALGHQRLGVELLLDPVGPVVQPRGVAQGRAHDRRDDERRVRLGEGLDELAAPVGAHGVPQLLEVGAHGRAASGRRRAA